MKSVTAFPEPDRISGAPHPRDTLRLIGQSEAENNFLAAFNSNRLHHGWLINGAARCRQSDIGLGNCEVSVGHSAASCRRFVRRCSTTA